MRALVSIHDVMPDTLEHTRLIVERLPVPCRANLLLLVVPGKPWRNEEIDQLRCWADEGFILVGHGWSHEAGRIGGWYHRLHSVLVSRNAAEHLALTNDEIEALMCRNSHWFVDHGFTTPDYYVPPAWALGQINRAGLARTPFKYLETTSGIVNLSTGDTRYLPLAGFEADTPLRQVALGVFNRMNGLAATETRPLRIAIHPFDFDYRLAGQLSHLLGQVTETVHYSRMFPAFQG
ncbi:MAG: polysaccharide deacetylase family protein [Pseudomonadota bacterium]